ncbi:hypothetical protein A2U01_0053266, partial [Trifolium medium]|nr:hypothetical protein [Trifolium medium]
MVTYFVCIVWQSVGKDTLGLRRCEIKDSARKATMREGGRSEIERRFYDVKRSTALQSEDYGDLRTTMV